MVNRMGQCWRAATVAVAFLATAQWNIASAQGRLPVSSTAAVQQQPAAPLPGDGGTPIEIGRSYRISSKILGDQRTINVYLPEDYQSGRRFPVVYLLDGGVNEDFLHIAGLAQINAAYGQGTEVIIVGIAGHDRRHDLTSPSHVPADLKVAPTSGGAAAYRHFLVDELQPWVAARFRTDGTDAIIGESLAGLFILETFALEPQDFDDYIAVSPSLWWNDGDLASRFATLLRSRPRTGRKLWVGFETPPPPAAAAALDRKRQQQVEQALKSSPPGLSWTVEHFTEGHANIYHPAAMAAFRKLFGPPPSMPDKAGS